MSDAVGSEESNDMIMYHPDIEELESKRKFQKERIREESRQKRLEEKRLAEEEALQIRKKKALNGMKYLLSISQKYSDFFIEKIFNVQKTTTKPLQERNKLQPTMDDMKEAVILKTGKFEQLGFQDVTKQLSYFEGGKLHKYQIEGVKWMSGLFENGINGILADEMGLGKTVQVIALICYLLERKVQGPYLIVAPLSTIPNWEAEFKRFAPKIPTFVFQGSAFDRSNTYRRIKKKYPIGNFHTYPVVLTTYQVPLLEYNTLNNFNWQYIIVDEGHRVKNHESKLSQKLRSLTSENRLLLTGTPLQNNITELWALLNFLMPHIFNHMDTFTSLLMLEDVQDEDKLLEQEEKTNLISTLHRILAPFMLRRLKKDVLLDLVPKKEINVFCPLSKLQRDLYSYVINKNMAQLRGEEKEVEVSELLQPRKRRKCVRNQKYFVPDDSDDDFSDYENKIVLEEEKLTGQKIDKGHVSFIVRLTMTNTMMMFRKIVDHPYLIHFPLDPNYKEKTLLLDENIINHSGKMMVLDAMLPKLKQKGHKVIIFSTLVMTLELIEELMIMRDHKYLKLVGRHGLKERGENIEEFNTNPDIFAFLISTRAGGLGLNLTGADTVIFFDRDWNPQADIQAQDRCHRIGQTKPVMVYTLVTKNTIDEEIITRGYQKRRLEKLVIRDGKFQTLKKEDREKVENGLRELQDLLKNDNDNYEQFAFSTAELDRLLDRSELYKIMDKAQKK